MFQLIEEALYRQIEIYEILGLKKEAADNLSVLARDFPQSKWLEKARNAAVVKD